MGLLVTRKWFDDISTCGELRVDEVFQCYTLEPRKDQSKGKPYCIPVGTYDLILQPSQRFHMTTPHLLGVPGFTEVEIHPGNYPSDTHACLLPGKSRLPQVFDPRWKLKGYAVYQSREAFNALMKKLLTITRITYEEAVGS